MQRFGRLLGGAALLALTSACLPTRAVVHNGYAVASSPTESREVADTGSTMARSEPPHVIIISIDGLRPDAIERYGTRNIARLIAEGSYSLEALTITPSITLPSHTSMLTGAPPEVHGIIWNDNLVDVHGRVGIPTIFEAARADGFSTAAFASKGKFNHLFSPSGLDFYILPAGNRYWASDRTARNFTRHLDEHRPNLMFVHLPEPDRWGHAFGWMGFLYGIAVRKADAAVGTLLQTADDQLGEGNYTVILTADHGGEGRGHEASTLLDRMIPWIAWGRGVVPGELEDGIHTTDTAATVLWLLGIDAPSTVSGSPIREAFEAPLVTVGVAAGT